MKNKKMQYRLIKVDNEWRIRGITTTRYHNYDNYLAIYVTLLSLHRYAKEHHINYRIEKAYISDSEIAIFIEQNQPTTIIGFGKVYFGVIIVNNEVKEKAFSMQYRYRIVDDKGNQFGAIPQIEETVYDIKHNTKVEYLAERLNNLNENIRKNIMDQIMAIANAPYLSEDQIYAIFKKIIRAKKLSEETKNKAQRLRDEKVVTNTLSIIEAFNRLNEITTDIDEHIHLEREFIMKFYRILRRKSKKDGGNYSKFIKILLHGLSIELFYIKRCRSIV
jgi:preprotein translocase subunit Sss1